MIKIEVVAISGKQAGIITVDRKPNTNKEWNKVFSSMSQLEKMFGEPIKVNGIFEY